MVDRLAAYETVSTALALLSDRRLADLVDAAPLAGSGVGGTNVRLEIEGVRVFAKRVPLTDLERQPEHVRSTANLFGVPTFCQYGVGAFGTPGFGAWRELAAHAMSTNWVLAGRSEAFPLMYHWRVLDGETSMPDEWADVDAVVEYWHGSPAIRDRLEAIRKASASIVLFLEYVPQNLRDWLDGRLRAGPDATEAACAMVERCLTRDVAFMNANGLLHFDAHFGNILTDGERLYLTDFGLVASPRFDVSPQEREFLERNRTHDGCYTMTALVNWLVGAVEGAPDVVDRNARIRRYAEGAEPTLPPTATAIVKRYAPIAAVVNDFYWSFFGESRETPYPADRLASIVDIHQ
jgi:hypothetical protein